MTSPTATWRSLSDLQFDQVQVRENETKELAQLLDLAPCSVKVRQKGRSRA
jgi:hypothetical protein